MSILGANVKRLRQAKGWNIPELSRKSGVGETTIREIEAGRDSIRSSTHSRLAEALGVSYYDLNHAMPAETFEFREVDIPVSNTALYVRQWSGNKARITGSAYLSDLGAQGWQIASINWKEWYYTSGGDTATKFYRAILQRRHVPGESGGVK